MKEKYEYTPTWNYECIRDFSGSFVRHAHSRNEKLMLVFPKAVNEYAKRLAASENLSFEDVKHDVISTIDYHDEDMVDYRTGIDCKKVIIDCLSESKQPTKEELAAILDVLYIDSISVELELVACELIDSGYVGKRVLGVV